MVAICSDIDGTRVDTFRETHRFLNTTAATAAGPGVGLDIADSAWFYQPPHDGKIGNQIAYFTDLSWNSAAPWAGELVEYMRCGWIDTLHTYGNFSTAGEVTEPPVREHAVRALEVLERSGIKLRVWVNHGDRHNRQNIGNDGSMRGDRPDAVEYHTDLLRAYGTEYIWAHGLTDVPGGPSVVSPVALNDGGRIFGFRRFSWRRNVPDALRIATLYGLPRVSRRGQELLQVWHPNGLPFQIAAELLTDLVNSGHLCVFAQHLGFMFPLTTFDAPVVAALRRLRQFQDRGLILIARTSRLVHYNRVRDYLRFSVVEREDGSFIDIHAVEDPVRGFWVPSLDDLRGITFEMSPNWPAELRLNGKPIAGSEIAQLNDGRIACIGIRWFTPDTTDYALPFLQTERRTHVLWSNSARIRARARAPAARAFLSSECGMAASHAGSTPYLSAVDCARARLANGLEGYIAAFERAGLSEMDRGLDVGCGPGHWSLAFLEHGGQVTGLDSRREFVRLARRLAHRFGHEDRAQFVVDPLTGFRRGRNRFDCAWSHSPRVFAENAESVMINIAHALRWGAPFYCRYRADGYYVREICSTVVDGQSDRLMVLSERYLNACLNRCGVFHTRGDSRRIMSLENLIVLGRTFGLGYVGQPVIPDEPTRFSGLITTFDMVLQKIENPKTARARLFEAEDFDTDRLDELERIAACGAAALVCVLICTLDPGLTNPSARNLYARSLIRAGLARSVRSAAVFETEPLTVSDLAMGLYRHDGGDFQGARSCYERLDDASADKAFLTGMCHYHQSDWRRARKAFESATERAGRVDPRPWVGLIAAHERLGDPPAVFEAQRNFVTGLEAIPQFEEPIQSR